MADYNVDPDGKFNEAIREAILKVGDLTEPFQEMTKEWFKGNKSIFDLNRKSKGRYEDLTEPYKSTKTRYLGSPYPILVGFLKPKGSPATRSGKLAKSMIDPTDSDSINVIINRQTLLLGTRVTTKKGAPYGIYLHKGTSKMAARPFVLIGGEQVANPIINKRREAWIMLLKDYVRQVTEKAVG